MITAELINHFSAAHRIAGHDGEQGQIHGHNFQIEVQLCNKHQDGLDTTGIVVDRFRFNTQLMRWIGNNWNNHLILGQDDPIATDCGNVYRLPFKTATTENMARHLLDVLTNAILANTEMICLRVRLWETPDYCVTVTP